MYTTVPPEATTIMSALTAAGVGALWETEEGLLLAHPLTASPDDALNGEHVHIEWARAVPNMPTEKWATLDATAYRPDGGPDFAPIGVAYSTPAGRPLDQEAAQCARAVAQWFAEPRPTAGGMLLAALAEYGITTYVDYPGMGYGVAVDQEAAPGRIYSRFRLSVGHRDGSVTHVPAAHAGWTIVIHTDEGEPLGDLLYVGGDGGLMDCAEDSAAAAAVIADFVTLPDRHCDCYAQERYGRWHDFECNRYRRT
ncbi:hypothetical protein [Streptomyces microflavus]|uniref:hypothetical protein n=1 Tax=Streptomyces microflavus TaxID=1919 RepID=UPI00365321C5